MKKKVLLSSLATIALCLSLIAGATFALFTSKSTSSIEVTAGEVKIEAAIDSTLKTWSLGETENDARTDKTFTNGGTVELVDGKLIINSMTPGDTVQFKINVTNDSNVAIKYRVVATSTNGGTDVDLSDALVTVAGIDGVDYSDYDYHEEVFVDFISDYTYNVNDSVLNRLDFGDITLEHN